MQPNVVPPKNCNWTTTLWLNLWLFDFTQHIYITTMLQILSILTCHSWTGYSTPLPLQVKCFEFSFQHKKNYMPYVAYLLSLSSIKLFVVAKPTPSCHHLYELDWRDQIKMVHPLHTHEAFNKI